MLIVSLPTKTLTRCWITGLGYNNSSPWSLAQAWFVLTTLAERPEASFEKMLFSSTFNGNDEPLHAMQRAGLIRIHRKNVVDVSHRDDVLPVVRQKMFVQPARPLFIEAFRRVVQDPTLSSGIQLQVDVRGDATAVVDH